MATDPYASAAGVANSTMMTHLIRALVNKHLLTKQEADQLLVNVQQQLRSHQTEIAVGGVGIVQSVRDALDEP